MGSRCKLCGLFGEVSERPIEHAWKACKHESVSWVRIPPSPNPFFVLLERGGQKKDSREQATKCGLRGGFEVRPRAEPAPKGESHPLRILFLSSSNEEDKKRIRESKPLNVACVVGSK